MSCPSSSSNRNHPSKIASITKKVTIIAEINRYNSSHHLFHHSPRLLYIILKRYNSQEVAHLFKINSQHAATNKIKNNNKNISSRRIPVQNK